MKKWPVVSKKLMDDFRIFKVFAQEQKHPITNENHLFYVLDAPDWINVIPLIDQDHAILIKQYRCGNDLISLEIPGGIVDHGESPIDCASRELLEETGYTSTRIEPTGWSYPNPAMQNNKCHFFVAHDCKLTHETNFDAAELIETEIVPLKKIPELIASKQISHSLMELAFLTYFSQKKP